MTILWWLIPLNSVVFFILGWEYGWRDYHCSDCGKESLTKEEWCGCADAEFTHVLGTGPMCKTPGKKI